jgi:hypothetical protein
MKVRGRRGKVTTVFDGVVANRSLVAGVEGRFARQDQSPWRGCRESCARGGMVPRRYVMSIRGDRLMKTNKTVRAVFAVIAAVVMTFSPVAAVTDGELDGGRHPHVGLMVAQDSEGNALWRCSGTLLSPTVFITAGHCTVGAEWVEIWFADDVTDRIIHDYPNTGDVGGTPYTYPSYGQVPFYQADVGIVVLSEEYFAGVYGALPEAGSLTDYGKRRGQNDIWFTAVGYGLQASFPEAASWKDQAYRIRMVSYPGLIQINNGIVGPYSMLLTNNAYSGGTCFGDSGGPNFIRDTNVIAGITSFGLNGNCAGTGGVFRLDQPDVLSWVNGFLSE